MEETECYEDFPLWIALLSGLFTIAIYALGAYILRGFGALVVVPYLGYCAWIELRVMKMSCVDCYYYGRLCGLGRGKLAPMLFKKGDPKRFVEREIGFSELLPDFVVPLFPLIGGIVLLVRGFNWTLAVALTSLVLLFFGGNAFIRGSLACKYCKQRLLGCPAEEVFRKE